MSITPRPSTGAARRGRRGRRPSDAPPTFVSLLWPAARRRMWWYLATCPVCGSPHLGRERELAQVARVRSLPCGHRVKIVIARTYGRPEAVA